MLDLLTMYGNKEQKGMRTKFLKMVTVFAMLQLLLVGTVEAETAPYEIAKKHEPQASKYYQPESAMTTTQTGQILYDYQGEDKLYPASVVKMMTFYLVYDALDKGDLKLSNKVKITADHQGVAQLPNVSTHPIKAGQEFTVEELLQQAVMVSSNAATMVLAERVSGDTSTFTKQMNDKARAFHMKDTYFTNPAGLDNAWLLQYAPKDFQNAGKPTSTAYDLSILANRLVKDHPEILEISKLRTSKQQGGTLHTTNYSLPGEANGMDGVDGLKTGTSDTAYHFMLTAKQQDLRLQTAVLTVAPFNDNSAKHARHIVANGITKEMFERYTYKKVLSKGEHRIQDKKYEVKQDLYDVVPKNMKITDKDFKIDEENQRITLNYQRQFLTGYQAPSVAIEKKGFELFGKEPWPPLMIVGGLFLVMLLTGFALWLGRKMRV
ncbi:penicillin-binding protein [Staphylococcus rostri]|uniref:Penicillin-binding protein n=2 Tax=Staphylococcus rostri TaxID=522262 RepID=A0A2K3YRF4_9STAP|nr:penicillin-binding protein [Staphylococcus rostri]